MKSHSIAPNFNVAGLKSFESSRAIQDGPTFWKRFGQLFQLSGLLERVAGWLVGPVEPQIYKRHDRRGVVYYKLYDPKTAQHRFFSFEEDVRIWLDQRF